MCVCLRARFENSVRHNVDCRAQALNGVTMGIFWTAIFFEEKTSVVSNNFLHEVLATLTDVTRFSHFGSPRCGCFVCGPTCSIIFGLLGSTLPFTVSTYFV